jgi:hypothetical protein
VRIRSKNDERRMRVGLLALTTFGFNPAGRLRSRQLSGAVTTGDRVRFIQIAVELRRGDRGRDGAFSDDASF